MNLIIQNIASWLILRYFRLLVPKWHSIVHTWISQRRSSLEFSEWSGSRTGLWSWLLLIHHSPMATPPIQTENIKHKTGEVDSTNLCAVKLQCTTLIQEWRPVVQQCSGCTAYFPWKPEFVGPLFAKMQINFLLSALTVPGNVANCRNLFMDIFGIHSVALRLGLTLLHKCSHHYAITKNVALPWSLPIF